MEHMASRRHRSIYFSKHVGDLTLPEAALLAALPKGAEYYSPINHPERALRAAQPRAKRDAC